MLTSIYSSPSYRMDVEPNPANISNFEREKGADGHDMELRGDVEDGQGYHVSVGGSYFCAPRPWSEVADGP
jgi:hypothetical protein